VPLGMTLNPSSLSGTQRLNLWSKGFWERERERERERGKEIKGSKGWERKKEGRKRFSWSFVFDLERALWRRDVDLKKGWWLVVGLPREGKEEEKGFWVLVVLTCFWGRVLVFGFLMVDWWSWWDKSLDYYQSDRTKSLSFLLKVKKAQNQRFFHLFLISFFFFFFFFSKLIESPSVRMKERKGFWVLVVLACFWGRVLFFGFWSMIDEVDGTKVLITIKGIIEVFWFFFLLAKRPKIKGFFTCF
jgi:hypothetical protein